MSFGATRLGLLIVSAMAMAMLLANCSGDSDRASGPTQAPDVIDLTHDTATAATATDSNAASAPTTAAEVIEIDDEPVVRVEGQETIDATNWLARTFMSSTTVELVWSRVDGADNYRLFRIPTADADYDAIAAGDLDGAEEIYSGRDGFGGFVDEAAPTNTFLTYILVAEVGGQNTEPRWAEALTVDDITPPAPLTGLTGTVTDDGVLLEWEPSPDDVEFAAYNVSYIDEFGELRYIGGGADVGQVSFLDDEVFEGSRTYIVTAVDFHNNVSDPGQVEITR